MHTSEIEYGYEGTRLKGFLAYDETRAAPLPGVLVVHDAGGLRDEARGKARRLAEQGYAAFALDLFGDAVIPPEPMKRVAHVSADLARWRGLARAGLEVLAAQRAADASRLAAIGYCFGGTTVYELARSGADVKGVVGFHSGLSPSSGEARNIKGKVLALLGADDPLIPPEARLAFEREMREAGVDWQMVLYGNTAHSFTNPAMSQPGFSYQPDADRRSWAEMLRFLDEVLAPPER